MPLRIDRTQLERGNHNYYASARLAPGVTPEQATAALRANAAARTAEGAYPPAMEFAAFAVPVADEILGKSGPPC
jgi:hypothetical protein